MELEETAMKQKIEEAKRILAMVQVALHKALKEKDKCEEHVKRALDLLSHRKG
jgi:uncharacterized protein YfkK (UPF0435 family)